MVNTEFRQTSDQEETLIRELLANDFVGRREVEMQLRNCNVRAIDSYGSLELKPSVTHSASVTHRVPTEIWGEDEDGILVHVLLHVIDGMCKEIEIYKDSPSSIVKMPKEWTHFSPG
ncbi:DUF6984 family protein [Halothiobacillus diazotrophicus]|uniref:DUF6984 family protein n=1 Tax=Halothiobacillus diazotrophicus TaxID=1860122 RepID=UPI00389924B3